MEEIFVLRENIGTIKSPKDVLKNIKKFKIDYTQENFIILYLNTQNVVLGSEVLFKGAVDMVIIDPKILFKKALLNNSAKIIIGHNHPSGDLTPSEDDREINRQLKKGGELLRLEIVDNITFNETEFFSYI